MPFGKARGLERGRVFPPVRAHDLSIAIGLKKIIKGAKKKEKGKAKLPLTVPKRQTYGSK